MATVHYSGDVATWQQAFEPHVERITRYLRRCVRGKRDSEELCQEGLCLALRDCKRFWRIGSGHTQYLGFIVTALFRGQRLVGRPHRYHASVQARFALVEHDQRSDRSLYSGEERRDFWLDATQLGERNATILHMLAAGHTWDDITCRLKTARLRIGEAVVAARLLMQD